MIDFRAYQFKLEEVEGFRYRAKDAWRAVTRIAVREARLKEIKQEIFNCQKLKVSLLFPTISGNYRFEDLFIFYYAFICDFSWIILLRKWWSRI